MVKCKGGRYILQGERDVRTIIDNNELKKFFSERLPSQY